MSWQPWPALQGQAITLGARLTRGPNVRELERRLSERFGLPVVAVSSGTTALEACIGALGVTPGQLVAVPAYGFHAAGLAAARIGAHVVPVEVDVQGEFTMHPERLRDRLRVGGDWGAVIAIDQAGHPAAYRELTSICAEFEVPLIEDAGGAWGSRLDGVRLGCFGSMAALSLSESKVLGTGEGGLVVSASKDLIANAAALARYGETSDVVSESRIARLPGSNWKMSETTAAIALIQLESLDERVARGAYASAALDLALSSCQFLEGPRYHSQASVAWHKYRVRHPAIADRERLLKLAGEVGVDVLLDDFSAIRAHPGVMGKGSDRGIGRPTTFTFVIGSRDEPIWHVRDETLERWRSGLQQLDERSSEWML